MKKLFLLGIVVLPTMLHAQRLHLNLFGGFSNYQGDLQDKPYTVNQAGGAFGAGIKYDLTQHFSLRSSITLARIGADDKKNSQPDLKARNLNFKTNITEGNLLLEYNLLNLQQYRFTPYVFGGVAVFHFNPSTRDTLGNKLFLKELSTEGQGLAQYPDRKSYGLTQVALPFGGGIKLRVTDNVVIGYEIGLRKTSTDYLDDVSTNYVDQAVLLAAKGPKAVEMAYRGGELKDGNPYPADGTVRGGSKYKDWYYFSGFSISIGLGGSKIYRGGGRGRTDCPPGVL